VLVRYVQQRNGSQWIIMPNECIVKFLLEDLKLGEFCTESTTSVRVEHSESNALELVVTNRFEEEGPVDELCDVS
jgi:hypothetical protein